MSENEEIDKGLLQDSFTFGSAVKGGCFKVYFNVNLPFEDVRTNLDKALKVLDYLRKLGYCKGE